MTKSRQPRLPQQAKRQESAASDLPPDVLDKLPENVRISILEAAKFSGPLPPPSMYKGYEEVLPGSAERILTMAEKEQEHRITWESKALHVMEREVFLGQWFGLGIALCCIIAAVFLAASGYQWVASILVGVSAVGLVGRFITKRNSQ